MTFLDFFDLYAVLLSIIPFCLSFLCHCVFVILFTFILQANSSFEALAEIKQLAVDWLNSFPNLTEEFENNKQIDQIRVSQVMILLCVQSTFPSQLCIFYGNVSVEELEDSASGQNDYFNL